MSNEKIDDIEALKVSGRYEDAIHQIEDSIASATDDSERLLYLTNLVVCATNIRNEAMARGAIDKLYQLRPLPGEEPFRNYVAGCFFLSFAEPQKAFELFLLNLENPILLAPEFREHRYENLAQCGFALCHLGRYTEALSRFDEAEEFLPARELHVDIEFYRITCLVQLKRLDEAARIAERATQNGSTEIRARARFDLAEIRFEQRRFEEALSLYSEVETLLPCDGIAEFDVRRGISTSMDALTKTRRLQ
ncbi:MAG TPA: tetratricopeptide repeat protein [Acidobacteriaceae bacterium]|nr:tetratricopeptide repeat protein [Acidobacteriaceae bacterium]